MSHIVYKVKYFNALHEQVESIHILAHNWECGIDNANFYLDELIGEGCWQIIEMKPKPQINIVNASILGEDEDQPSEVKFREIKCECGTINQVPQGMTKSSCHKCHKDLDLSPDEEGED